MLETLLPQDVVSITHFGNNPEAVLFPEEAVQVATAIDARRREFATARTCARQAITKLGYSTTAILRGPSGEPLWPPGIVGCITHCQGFRAAAVGRSNTVRGIGIDAEPYTALYPGVRSLILRPEELRRISLPCDNVYYDLLAFAAKECVFKVWFPIVGTWLDYKDAIVSCNCKESSFCVEIVEQANLARQLGLAVMYGKYAIHKGLLLVALTIRPL